MDAWWLILVIGGMLGSVYLRHGKWWQEHHKPNQPWTRWWGGKKSGLQHWNQEDFTDEELWDSDGDLGRPYREWPLHTSKPTQNYGQFAASQPPQASQVT